jgi:hypothetical protein
MRYDDDILASAGSTQGLRRVEAVDVPAAPGLLVRDRASRFSGRLVRLEAGLVVLQDARGRERVFPLTPGGFVVDGRVTTLVRPRPRSDAPAGRTRSGSVAAANSAPRTARAGRIFVEGVHDAELVEKVWGDDLRELGIVVEYLEGIDDLGAVVARFGAGPDRRLGVLVDHLLPGTKESRIVAAVDDPHVLVTGHPFVDVWAAVRPRTLGLQRWPVVPHGRPWKEGVCAALGVSEPWLLWRRILRAVESYADLEPPMVGAVEQLIDFVDKSGTA